MIGWLLGWREMLTGDCRIITPFRQAIQCPGRRCGRVDVDGGGFDYEFLRRDRLSYGGASPCDFALVGL